MRPEACSSRSANFESRSSLKFQSMIWVFEQAWMRNSREQRTGCGTQNGGERQKFDCCVWPRWPTQAQRVFCVTQTKKTSQQTCVLNMVTFLTITNSCTGLAVWQCPYCPRGNRQTACWYVFCRKCLFMSEWQGLGHAKNPCSAVYVTQKGDFQVDSSSYTCWQRLVARLICFVRFYVSR